MKRALAHVLLLLLSSAPASGQAGRVASAEENLRAAPGGSVLGVVRQGTLLEIGAARGEWREATLDGWIWSASVSPTGGIRHDLRVHAPQGENLRASPNGDLLAVLNPGAVLKQVERRGSWTRVRRTGWIWSPSLRVPATNARGGADPGAAAAPVPAAAPVAAAAPAQAPERSSGAGDAVPAEADEAGEQRTPSDVVSPASPAGEAREVRGAAVALRGSAGGDTLAVVASGTPLTVVGEEGAWVRVRIEGWVPRPALEEEGAGEVLRDVAAASVTADPEAFRGRRLEWDLQFIALERATAERTDLADGEAYILARGPGEENGLVYVAVPEARLPEVRRLNALERFVVQGRLRVPRSPLTGAPILDLEALRTSPRR